MQTEQSLQQYQERVLESPASKFGVHDEQEENIPGWVEEVVRNNLEELFTGKAKQVNELLRGL